MSEDDVIIPKRFYYFEAYTKLMTLKVNEYFDIHDLSKSDIPKYRASLKYRADDIRFKIMTRQIPVDGKMVLRVWRIE